MKRFPVLRWCVINDKVITHVRKTCVPLSVGILSVVLPIQADEPAKVSRSETNVFLENATNLTTLIAAEANWISTNFHDCEFLSFMYDLKRLNVISNKLHVEIRNRDLANIKINGANTKVIFWYDEIPMETSIQSLWPDYMLYLMITNSQSSASVQLGRFVSTIKRMDIILVLPYLIKQLDDDRLIKILLVSDGTRVCDLVVFSLLKELQYAQTGEFVFLDFGSKLQGTGLVTRADADAAVAQIKFWWNTEGERLTKQQQVTWLVEGKLSRKVVSP